MTNEDTKIVIPETPKKTVKLNKHQVENKIKHIVMTIIRLIFLISVSYIIVYPLFAMIAYTLMSGSDVMDPSVIWIARNPTFDNVEVAFESLDYINSLIQTVLVGVVSALIEVISCAIAAYGFARFKFKGRGILFGLVLLTAIVPVQVLAIPLYLNYRFINLFGLTNLIGGLFGNPEFVIDLTNTPLTFWLPSLFGVGLRSGLFIFIYRQFFMGLPKELEEASWIDGAGPLKTFIRVVIPSSGVVFLTVTIFSIIWHWNEYYLSVLYFQNDFPLAVALSGVSTAFESAGIRGEMMAGPMSAACLMFILPMLIMFLFLQKKFIQSIDRVGIVR